MRKPDPNRLWIVWVILAAGGFATLEWWGLHDRRDRMKPLTYWSRRAIRRYPLVGTGMSMGLGWLAWHFFTEPFWRERRRMWRRKEKA